MRAKFLILFSCIFLFVGCASPLQKRNEAISKGVYATNAAIKAHRYDLAAKYSEQLVRIVAPPDKKVVIKPIQGGKVDANGDYKPFFYTVLPEGVDSRGNFVTAGEELTKLGEFNPSIELQLKEEKKDVEKFSNQVDNSIKATEKAANKAEQKKSGGWWGWILSIFGGLGVLGVIALCIFFPAAIPLIINIFEGLISAINRVIAFISNSFKKKE